MSGDRKVALVTGSARGIGAATALRFRREGYMVVGCDIEEPERDIAVSQEFHRCDVTNQGEVERFVANVVSRHRRIDVLANVAGVVLVKPLVETTWEDFQRVVSINLGGAFLLLKYVLPVMQRQKAGAVINVASVSGHVGQIDHGLYGATKAGIIALSRSLAWEMAPYKIRVNSLSPGSVNTPMLHGDIAIESRQTKRSIAEVKAQREAEQAFGRWADPTEIAAAIHFLASDEASFVTGTDLLVDGGWTAR